MVVPAPAVQHDYLALLLGILSCHDIYGHGDLLLQLENVALVDGLLIGVREVLQSLVSGVGSPDDHNRVLTGVLVHIDEGLACGDAW